MTNIIFLDFDGVMDTASYDMYLVANNLPECDGHGRPEFDPECVENLRNIIEVTKADVVVTSDWKYTDKYQDLLQMWHDRKMPGFMIGITPNLNYQRGEEIQQWLIANEIKCNYVIIDDLNTENFKDDQQDKLVVVNPHSGLDKDASEKAIAILVKQINKEDN